MPFSCNQLIAKSIVFFRPQTTAPAMPVLGARRCRSGRVRQWRRRRHLAARSRRPRPGAHQLLGLAADAERALRDHPAPGRHWDAAAEELVSVEG